MKGYSPSDKLVVRDSVDLSDISEVEDDVFIRDGRTCKMYEDTGLKRPLMPPRRKTGKGQKIIPIMKKRTRCWTCCEPFCYGLAAITILIALIFLAALILTMFPVPLQKIKIWLRKDLSFTSNYSSSFSNLFHITGSNNDLELVPCSEISVQEVWSKAIAKLSSETPVRKADLTNDGIDDVIIAYGIEEMADGEELPKCKFTKSGLIDICTGGVLALNGLTGAVLWQKWTAHTIFSVFCSTDLNNDTNVDCVASGRGGLIIAIDGKNGSTIWESTDASDLQIITVTSNNIDLYTVNVIRDVNDDGVNDIVAAHVEDNGSTSGSHIKLISGATGEKIRMIPAPNREEIFVPIQLVTDMDGSEFLLVLTGGQNSPGGVYKIPLFAMAKPLSQVSFGTIFRNPDSGFMVPAVIVDINGDTIDDIIVSDFNSTVYAFDGKSYTPLWTYSFQGSECLSSIVPGHYDHDNVTDFLVKYSTGPGFPIYYYSQTTILSGVNGTPIVDVITDSGGPNSLLAGFSISQKYGGDIFLHWESMCSGIDNYKDTYQFIPESDLIQQSRADICQLRYNATTELKLYGLSRHVEPPGVLLYSTNNTPLKLNQTDNKDKEPNKVAPALKHPKMKNLRQEQMRRMKDKTKETELNGNTSDPNQAEPDQDAKRTESTTKKTGNYLNSNNNNKDNDGSGADDDNDEMPKEKPRPHNDRNKFAIEMNEGGAFVPEPYQYVPTFDDKLLEREYKLKIPNPNRLDDAINEQLGDYEYGIPDESDLPPIPKNPRNRFGNRNRGVRSKNEKIMVQDSSIVKKNLNDHVNGNIQLANDKLRPESLWDLELEKEEYEAFRFKRQSNTDGKPIQMNSDVLPAISSTGVLLASLNGSKDAIDYVFVLNVRQSEKYPPLLLKEDIACVEEKMQGFRSYAETELRRLERKFFKQCLSKRIPFLQPPYQRFETEIVVTRIRIQCKCSEDLDPSKEKCSDLNPVGKQQWPEFMGRNQNGAYKSRR